eukprot:2769254-Amphidinium_carterae.1
MNPQEAKLLVTLHAGAVCTADRAQRHLGRGDGLCRTCNTPATVMHILWQCRRTQPLWAHWHLPLPDSATVLCCLLPVEDLPQATFSALCAHGVLALQRWLSEEPRQDNPEQLTPSLPPRSRAQPVKGRSLGPGAAPHLKLSDDQQHVRCTRCGRTALFYHRKTFLKSHHQCTGSSSAAGRRPQPVDNRILSIVDDGGPMR